jgi:hypothetical protein
VTETLDVSERLRRLGQVRVLDLAQAAAVRGLRQEWIYGGHYYLLPPPEMTAAELQKVMDEFKDRGALHLSYNAQSAIDMNHKPLLPLDSYAETFFGDTPHGVVKVTAVARSKVEELNSLIDNLKLPFDAGTFPGIGQVTLTNWRPPAEGRQTVVSLKLASQDWKELTHLEEAIRNHLSEINMIREILVTRHSVKGMDPEVILTSSEETTDKGNAFLADLAAYLQQHQVALPASPEATPPTPQPVMPEVEATSMSEIAAASLEKLNASREVRAPDLLKLALQTLADTIRSMPEYQGMTVTVTGPRILVEFPKKGLLGLGGHFDDAHKKVLQGVYTVALMSPGLHEGWQAHYSYDKDTRLLSITTTLAGERPPAGAATLTPA